MGSPAQSFDLKREKCTVLQFATENCFRFALDFHSAIVVFPAATIEGRL